ncbi:hypothetical protein BGZ75_008563 [Mortierella antarctica]|nr:hypothetical protein BGZ75_008563 [Mortierella antarctica]
MYIFNAFKHNSSGDFFQSLGRRSEERTRHGLETPVVQPLDRDFTGQQQQQQQQHGLPNVERERVAAVVDQDLQGDALQHAVPETISGIEATEDEVPQDDSLRQTESEELHLGSVDMGDRPLTETIQPMEAHDLIDEGVFYEAEKVDMGMDTSLAYSVAHHPQPEEEEVVDEDASRYELVQESSYSVAHHPQPEEEEEDANRNELVQESSYSVDHHPQPEEEDGEDASRNELVQESRMLRDIEDPSEHWKGDPLQHLESEIPMLELTLSPPIEPYRVLRRQSSVEDFVDAAPTRKTRATKNAGLASSLDRKETQGLRNLPVTRPMSRRRDMDQDNSSSSGDGGGGGEGQLGYELLYPRFTSLKSSLVAASARRPWRQNWDTSRPQSRASIND